MDKVSIITVVYNNPIGLEKTIKSVINQSYKNKEFIVIDGGSTDNTIDIIKKYEKFINVWVSEPDEGIYDAMNKGIKLSSGKWVNFMNSGDSFIDKNVLDSIPFYKYSDYVLLYGNKMQNNKIVKPLPLWKIKYGLIHANHQSMFFNKELLGDEVYYKTKYKIYADYELVNRIYMKYKDKIKYINNIIADYEGNGISAKPSFQKRKDKYLILFEHYGFLGIIRGMLERIKYIGL